MWQNWATHFAIYLGRRWTFLLTKVRMQGFSFNRLAPYTSLDDYLPEIERTWGLFASIASPVQIRVVRLRYINRILLPLTNGRVELEDYLKVGPRLPDEDRLRFAGFLNQYAAVEIDTGHQVNIVLTSQPPENIRSRRHSRLRCIGKRDTNKAWS